MTEPDERDLAERAARGDLEAFAALIRAHQAQVFNVALRMLGERREAEDATQDAFVRAFRSFGHFDLRLPPGPWLKKIAVNVCLDRLERRAERSLDEETAQVQVDPAPAPSVRAEQDERTRRIRQELSRLPPRYRAAIELRHYQGLSYAEMAEALGRPLSDVKSDLFRARKLLAERLLDLKEP